MSRSSSCTCERSSTDHPVGGESEPTLYLIEPGPADGREREVEAAALFASEPSLERRAFVRAVVVQEVHLPDPVALPFPVVVKELPPIVTRVKAYDAGAKAAGEWYGPMPGIGRKAMGASSALL